MADRHIRGENTDISGVLRSEGRERLAAVETAQTQISSKAAFPVVVWAGLASEHPPCV